ncbi:MAG: DUF1569 domain-containing protein [Flavobacteriales bacterium]
MKNLFNQTDVDEILKRIEKLKPGSQRQWGKMNAAQMITHCNKSLETAMGKNVIKPLFIGGIIGHIIKKSAYNEKPFGKNSPTDKSYKFNADSDFEQGKSNAMASVKEFFQGGASKCTVHPHPFFGHFTPEQWAIFQWKHLDHHLRQFGL